MKVLLVNDHASSLGGTEVQLASLREGLRRRGHDARIFASSAESGSKKNFADYTCFGTVSSFRTLLQAANPWAYWKLRRVLKEFQPDVVHVKIFMTQLSPLILPLLKKIPSLFSVDWYQPVCPTGTKLLPDGSACAVEPGAACLQNKCLPRRDWFPKMLQRKLWRRWRGAFNRVAAVSAAVKEKISGEMTAPVEVVWNGVSEFSQRPPLGEPPTVAFAGYLTRVKGVEVLLRAFVKVREEIPAARLLIAGTGPEENFLKKLSAELGIASNTEWLGHLSREEMEQRFAGAWVQAVPSLWEEPFSNSAAEGMMRGTAVVASSHGCLKEMVEEGSTGLLVKPNSPHLLAAALLQLLQNRNLAEEMGRAARIRALALFKQEIYVEKMERLYERVVREKAS